jgi:hypothetical protein
MTTPIDPDYGRIYTMARIIAWQYGWAAILHGSMTRDLDILLVPWEPRAYIADGELIVKRIADAAGLKVSGAPSIKPHGRKAMTLLFQGSSDPRWVDISYMPPVNPVKPGMPIDGAD